MHIPPKIPPSGSLTKGLPQSFWPSRAQAFPGAGSNGEGQPQLGGEELSAAEAFAKAPFETWPEVGVGSVIRYLRGSKRLCAPQCWRAVFPVPFEILHRQECRKRSADHLD